MMKMEDWERDRQNMIYPMFVVNLDGQEYEPVNDAAAGEFVTRHIKDYDRVIITRVQVTERRDLMYPSAKSFNTLSDHPSADSSDDSSAL